MQTFAHIGAQCSSTIIQKSVHTPQSFQSMHIQPLKRKAATTFLSVSNLQQQQLQHRQVRKTVVGAASTSSAVPSITTPSKTDEIEIRPGIFEGYWIWEGHRIRYHRTSATTDTDTESAALLPSVLCIHGFGGNADHWRKNLPELASTCNAYAIDLLGYGFSDKPDPRSSPINSIYNFENWGRQIRDFIKEKIGKPTILSCNSVGGLAGLQAAIDEPELIPAVQVINISLRMLHESKQAPLAKPFVSALQKTLRTTDLGKLFFGQVATAQGVKSVLQQCYCDKNAVTDELVDAILKPGLEPGAVDVFLDFISYSGGPLPETLLQDCPVPVSVVWGAGDPWEKLEWGRKFATYPTVEEFIELPGVGHCPQDEAPHLVNPLILDWVARHSS